MKPIAAAVRTATDHNVGECWRSYLPKGIAAPFYRNSDRQADFEALRMRWACKGAGNVRRHWQITTYDSPLAHIN